jgi:hypothetical protein
MRFIDRTRALILVTVVAAAYIGLSFSVGSDGLVAATPVVVACWMLVAVDSGYFLLRAKHWQHRQALEFQAIKELDIPAETQKPVTFAGVASIDEAQHAALSGVADYQREYFAAGIKVAALPFLAVLALGLQTLAINEKSSVGIGLAATEALLLIFLAYLIWVKQDPTKQWVTRRIRSELFRREQYLRMVLVGPYLDLPTDEADHWSELRTGMFHEGSATELRRLIPMITRMAEGTQPVVERWIDQLWKQKEDSHLLEDDLEERMWSYLYYRLEKQLMWFKLGVAANEKAERQITLALKAALLAAVVIAGIHTILLSQHVISGQLSRMEPFPVSVGLLAFALPPACAVLLAVQELFTYRKLGVSYAQAREELLDLRTELQQLIFATTRKGPSRALRRGFQAMVLHTESALTQELQRWIMLVSRSEFEVSA